MSLPFDVVYLIPTILVIIVLIIGIFVYKKTEFKPIVIENLDLDGFIEGCYVAANPWHTVKDVTGLNPHALLGYKLTILMSSGKHITYDAKDEQFVVVTIGKSKDNPHVVYKYMNAMVKIDDIQEITNNSCCIVTLEKTHKPPKGVSTVVIIPRSDT